MFVGTQNKKKIAFDLTTTTAENIADNMLQHNLNRDTRLPLANNINSQQHCFATN